MIARSMKLRVRVFASLVGAIGGAMPALASAAPAFAWTDAAWSVQMPGVSAGGDTNYRRAFGRSINDGAVVETQNSDAWLKLNAHADVDITENSAIVASIGAARGFQLSGARYGWGTSLSSTLRGQLWNDDSFLELGTYSAVSAGAQIQSSTSKIMGENSYDFSNSTHQQTSFVNEARTTPVVLGNGDYRLVGNLEGQALIGDSCTACASEANSVFFASASEALSGGNVGDAARYGLHLQMSTPVPLGHLQVQNLFLLPQRIELVPAFSPHQFIALFDVFNDGDSAISISGLNFDVEELDETGRNDPLTSRSKSLGITLAAGEARRITETFFVDPGTINSTIDIPSDGSHLDFVMHGGLSWSNGFQTMTTDFAVPEPGALVLALTALLALGGTSRRKIVRKGRAGR